MLRVATRTNFHTLSGAAENALMDRLKGRFDHDSFIRNLALAEELEMRKFQGRLFYNELVRQEYLQTGIQLSTPSNLTEKQLFALFRGYWSLTCYWKNLPSIVQNKRGHYLQSLHALLMEDARPYGMTNGARTISD
jgi:hypothetical protein